MGADGAGWGPDGGPPSAGERREWRLVFECRSAARCGRMWAHLLREVEGGDVDVERAEVHSRWKHRHDPVVRVVEQDPSLWQHTAKHGQSAQTINVRDVRAIHISGLICMFS